MDKDKIIVSVVIDKQALVDRAFDISKNPSEFNEIKKVIDGKNQFTRDIDEIDDEGKKENNTNLFAGIALDVILCDNQELGITKRLNALEDKKNSFLAKMKKLDELQKKVKNGEVHGVEGFRELLKIMGVVSKYGNLYDVKKNIICHAPVTSSHFESILKKGNVLPMMTGVTTPKLCSVSTHQRNSSVDAGAEY